MPPTHPTDIASDDCVACGTGRYIRDARSPQLIGIGVCDRCGHRVHPGDGDYPRKWERLPRTLVMAYDVSDLEEAQTDTLLGEALVQAEASDASGDDPGSYSPGHPDVSARPVGVFTMPLDRVQGACEIAAESFDLDSLFDEDHGGLGLMLCVDGVEQGFIALNDGADTFNLAAERTALDKVYELKAQNPGSVVSVVFCDEREGAA